MSKQIEHRLREGGGKSAYVGASRVRVSDIARMYDALLMEFMTERIQEAIPHLSEGEIVAAIRYWREHRDEIAKELESDEEVLHAIKSAV